MNASSGRNHDKDEIYEGVITNFERRYRETSSHWVRELLEGYMVACTYDVCNGKSLNPGILNIFIDDKSIEDVCDMSILELYNWYGTLKLSK
jgi:excinuclease ABC subunit A